MTLTLPSSKRPRRRLKAMKNGADTILRPEPETALRSDLGGCAGELASDAAAQSSGRNAALFTADPRAVTIAGATVMNAESEPGGKPIQPFLKWVGGKNRLFKYLRPLVPEQFDAYYEPFLGSGAVFFGLRPRRAFLSDINPHLVSTYIVVRDRVEELIEHLREHAAKSSRYYYNVIRAKCRYEKDRVRHAAMLIYLVQYSYCAKLFVPDRGEFQCCYEPRGRQITSIYEERLRAASAALQGAEILVRPFYQIEIESGAFYYLDPPYHDSDVKYYKAEFNEIDQIQVAELCRRIDAAGAYFMVSNSDTPFIREIYRGFRFDVVRRPSGVFGTAPGVQELVIRNYNAGRTDAPPSSGGLPERDDSTDDTP